MENLETFSVMLIGIVFDPSKRKILVGQKEKSTWTFPTGKLTSKDDLDCILKDKIKKVTGLKVKNLGAIFSKASKKEGELSIYFLCEAVSGEEKAGDEFTEIKWVTPKKVETHLNTSFHSRLKEYIINLS